MWTKEELVVCSIGFVVEIILAVFMTFLLKNKSETIKKLPLRIIAIIFLIMEIFKQIDSFENGVYNFWSLPLHFCSFFMFFPLLAILAPKRFKKFFEYVSYSWSFVILVAMIINPSAIYGGAVNGVYYNFEFSHSFIFHELVKLYCLYCLFIDVYELEIENLWYMPVSIVIYGSISIPLAFKYDTNYCNILKANFVPFMEAFRLSAGQVMYDIALLLSGVLLTSVAYLALFYINKIRNKSFK